MQNRTIRVLVLAGGTWHERAVSLRSGNAVTSALLSAGYEATLFDVQSESNPVPVEILNNHDVIFPVIHGQGGEDGSLQQLLEDNSKVYVGSAATASAVCYNKDLYRQLLQQNGIATAAGELVRSETFQSHRFTKLPFVLKPASGGSSIDTFIVRDPTKFDPQTVAEAFSRYGTLLLEELVTGTEITVAVLDHTPLPVIEIIPPVNQEFDYANKYNGSTQELCPAIHISEQQHFKAQELALQIHELTDCRHYSRTDMFARPDGSLIVLETNTLPGMTNESLFPKAAQAVGITMPQLVDQLVQLAISQGTVDA